jgi:NADPH:quinone reductase-like Zn-dependent oxidoreductase
MAVAAAFSFHGPPSVLELITFEPGPAGPGEVRVEVRAAGVQPIDARMRGGFVPPGAVVTFPQILGNEFAGVIDQVGPGVSGWSAGDEVIGFRTFESYASSVVVPVAQLAAKPPSMSWEEAGALSASGQTAHSALEALAVSAGDTVLIHAAAGGVGTIAVQLARLAGAAVIGTASERNHDYLRSLGALPVSYGPGLTSRIRALGAVTAALDAIGTAEALDASVELVPDLSRIGSIAAFGLVSSYGIRWLGTQRSAARLSTLTSLYASGDLQVHISGSYPLAKAADAHREIETGHVRGKVVLTVP